MFNFLKRAGSRLGVEAVVLALAFINMSQVSAQETGDPSRKWSVSWGWNWEAYSKSDIHFRGADHDFTLKGVSANDKQQQLSINNVVNKWLNPANMTLPQTNMRVAYQWDADTAIALNLDHMKYVVNDNQTVAASGYHGTTTYPAGGTQTLDPSFMHYEHTDGLNVVSIEYEKQYALDQWQNARAFWLVGAGIVVPKSNITMTMLGRTRSDRFHLAGYAVDVGVGLEKDFAERFFVRTTAKLGHVNLPDVRTSSGSDKASQHFQFAEAEFAIGMRF